MVGLSCLIPLTKIRDQIKTLHMMQGAMSQDMHSGSYLDDPFCSRGTVNLHSEQGQKVSTGKAYSRFNINASSLKNFADDKMSYNIADEDNDIWKGSYVFHLFHQYFC